MEDMEKLLEVLSEVNEDVDFAHETALVDEGLIDELGSLDSALRWLYAEIERQGTAQNAGQSAKRGARRSAGQNTAKKTQRGGVGKSGPSRKKK